MPVPLLRMPGGATVTTLFDETPRLVVSLYGHYESGAPCWWATYGPVAMSGACPLELARSVLWTAQLYQKRGAL